MTTTEFYQELRRALQEDRGVHIDRQADGTLRLVAMRNEGFDDVFCPITYVAARLGHGYYRPGSAITAARTLDYAGYARTMAAADRDDYAGSPEQPYVRNERRRLLRLFRSYLHKEQP